MKHRSIIVALLLTACGSAGSTPGERPAPVAGSDAAAATPGAAGAQDAAEVVPCPHQVRGASPDRPWRLANGDGFTFCVPAHWRRVGRNSWDGDASSVTWDLGRPVVTTRTEIVRIRPAEVPPTARSNVRSRRWNETIGNVSVELWENDTTDGMRAGARWDAPRQMHMHGSAPAGRANSTLLDVFRTVRFTRD